MEKVPIFILGISQRSGTTYLSHLLRLHPECESASPIREDYLLDHAGFLFEYARSVYRSWAPKWGVSEPLREELVAHLGKGLLSFMSARAGDKRLLTKTPSVQNLELFFRLFPGAKLLILVRDGRAVVESYVRSGGLTYEQATERWVGGARTILDFLQREESGNCDYLVVKYEDLYLRLNDELERILSFLGLDKTVYDFSAARNLPVRGSSSFRGSTTEKVHWQPIEKTADFNPLERWRGWDKERLARFNKVAGELMKGLGYEIETATSV